MRSIQRGEFGASGGLGLPREAYYSEEWYDRELEQLFPKHWSFAGILADVRRPGDFITVTVGNSPLCVIRDSSGTLRAFHNVCRHRGTTLLHGKGNVSEGIRCAYHCWVYNLNGSLRSIPQPEQFPGVRKAEFGLHPASVAVFKGMIFVHAEPDRIANFAPWLGDFEQHFGPYDLNDLEEVMFTRREMKANWKLFVENHIESYHLWFAHRKSILGLDHSKQVNHYYNGHWSFFEPTLESGVMAEFERKIPSGIIAPNESWYGSGDHLLYPNLGIVTGAKFVGTLKVIPTSPTRSEIEMRLFGRVPNLTEITQGRYKYYERSGSSEGEDLNGEDIELCERVQESIRSKRAGIGALAAEYEQSIGHFHAAYMHDMAGRWYEDIRAGGAMAKVDL